MMFYRDFGNLSVQATAHKWVFRISADVSYAKYDLGWSIGLALALGPCAIVIDYDKYGPASI